MVVRDEDVDAKPYGRRDLGDARGPGVHGHDDPGAGAARGGHRREREAVALLEA
jgi:hypothetical protein